MRPEQLLEVPGKSHFEIIRLHAPKDSFLEIRALKRQGKCEEGMQFAGSRFIPVEAEDHTVRKTLQWAERQTADGTEIFIGYNARFRKGRSKADVRLMTACYADLDLGGADVQPALAAAHQGPIRARFSCKQRLWLTPYLVCAT